MGWTWWNIIVKNSGFNPELEDGSVYSEDTRFDPKTGPT